MSVQNIPNELRGKSQSEIIASFFQPPVGALIAAMISTFGIYFIASFLYVSLHLGFMVIKQGAYDLSA